MIAELLYIIQSLLMNPYNLLGAFVIFDQVTSSILADTA